MNNTIKYYRPYPIALELILVGMLGVIIGLIATGNTPLETSNQSASNNNSAPTGKELATGISDPDFNRALPHILKWEGTCSDHWADNGGRTYKGITTAVARKHGYTGDVCKMSDNQVFGIYYKDYWARVPKSLDFSRKLVYFNLLINGTKNRCLNAGTASAMLDCQQNYYNGLSDRTQFGDGWRNRNNYFKNIIGNN